MSPTLSLTQRRRFTCTEDHNPGAVPDGYTRLAVLYCAICRTDAKMWDQGHRDLALPRVPGHEIAGRDPQSGKLFTVWPGQACGTCRYCRDNRGNLCEKMKIIGFHSDGGFADFVDVPVDSLIPAADDTPPHLLCFAEPIACTLNAISAASLAEKEKVIIYGGGVLGMIAALSCLERGAVPMVIEQSEEKMLRSAQFYQHTGVPVCKDTTESDFDVAINACDSPIAFSLCITKLRKGGRLCFFSGLKKNEEIDSNLLNLIHYKELELFGSYGPRIENMAQAALFCRKFQEPLSLLIERIIPPGDAAAVMEDIISARPLKYIINFSKNTTPAKHKVTNRADTASPFRKEKTQLSPFLKNLITEITPVSREMHASAQKKIDLKTKPLGALGTIEQLAVQLCTIQHTLSPEIRRKNLFVFAADHGVVEEGISAYPAKVTRQMVENFLNHGAAINAFCNQYNIMLAVVDMGVNADFTDHPLLLPQKVRKGTRNFALQEAMTAAEALSALERGAKCFIDTQETNGCDLVGMGEMGIGNTSAASAIISCVTGISVADASGRGTGVDDEGLARKIEVLEKALTLHQPNPKDAIDLLVKIGGYEIAGIAGAVLAAAARKTCIVLDGHISTAAGLIAYLLSPNIVPYIISGHRSVEQGQRAALTFMGLRPVLDLDMRLGEGTGAAITMNLVELASRVMREMASFKEAGVDRKL